MLYFLPKLSQCPWPLGPYLWLQHSFLEVPREFQNKLIPNQSSSNSGLSPSPFWFSVLPLTSDFWPCHHLCSFQGDRVSKWKIQDVIQAVWLQMSLLFPLSQDLVTKKWKQKFACNPIKEFDKKRTRGGLRGGWKAVLPSPHTTPSRFDTISKEVCFLGLLADNPFTQPWPCCTRSAGPQATMESWRARASPSTHAHSTAPQPAL